MKYIITAILTLSLTVSYSDNNCKILAEYISIQSDKSIYIYYQCYGWKLNQAISNSLNSSTRGFVYVSENVAGNGGLLDLLE